EQDAAVGCADDAVRGFEIRPDQLPTRTRGNDARDLRDSCGSLAGKLLREDGTCECQHAGECEEALERLHDRYAEIECSTFSSSPCGLFTTLHSLSKIIIARCWVS